MQRSEANANRNPEVSAGISHQNDSAKEKAWRPHEPLQMTVEQHPHIFEHGGFGSVDAQGWLNWDCMNAGAPWGPSTLNNFTPYLIPHQDQLPYPDYDNVFQAQNNHQSWTSARQHSFSTDITSTSGSVEYLQDQPISPLGVQFQAQSIPLDHTQPTRSSSISAQQSYSPLSSVNETRATIAGDQQSQSPCPPPQALDWVPAPVTETQTQAIFINSFVDPSDTFLPTPPIALSWAPTANEAVDREITQVPEPVGKRKQPPSLSESKEQAESPNALSSFVGVFENAPGALAAVKKRKKLEEPVRKAAKDVRRTGACHQCRFRKRTCSTGTPCGTCLKNSSDLREIRCQRESPFVGKLMHQYFEHSSKRRVLMFDIVLPSDAAVKEPSEILIVDGVGRLSLPIRLRAQRRPLSGFNRASQDVLNKTKDNRKPKKVQDESEVEIFLLEESKAMGDEVEQWALEYTSKFVHAAGPNFYTTTLAQILGTAYVKKGLPESPLVGAMLRVASISFVLRAGVKYALANKSSSAPSGSYRTVQARIDSILYARLKLAERDLFRRLQALIFRTAGCLNKDQQYPVALVMWQLMRMMSIGASHLSNIVDRFGNNVSQQAEYLHHCQRLLLSVHLALFRTSTPLLLDFRSPSTSRNATLKSPATTSGKKVSKAKAATALSSSSSASASPPAKVAPNYNRSLLSDDDDLCRLAIKMRKVVLEFQRRGAGKEMKGSMGWRKDVWELYRNVYNGL